MDDFAGPVDHRRERQRRIDDGSEDLALRGFAGRGGRPFDQVENAQGRHPRERRQQGGAMAKISRLRSRQGVRKALSPTTTVT